MTTMPLEQQLDDALLELAQESRAYERSLRAEHEHRVCNRDGWRAALLRRRLRITELEHDVADLRAQVAA